MAGSTEITRVIFAVDGCVEVYALWLLVGKPFRDELYMVCHDWAGESPPERVEFCLLGNRGAEEYPQRVRPVFLCDFDGDPFFARCLSEGCPVATEYLLKHLEEETSLLYHGDIIWGMSTAFTRPGDFIRPSSATLRSTLTCLLLEHADRTAAVFRRLFNTLVTPFWLVSKFGPTEKGLTVLTRYYLLDAVGEGDDLDLQSLKDALAVFDFFPGENDAADPSELISFRTLSAFFCQSRYTRQGAVLAFARFLAFRDETDRREFGYMQALIDKFRGALRVPPVDFVTYLYLAHFECYGKEALWAHLDATRFSRAATYDSARGVGRRAYDSFFVHLRERFHLETHLKKNVFLRRVVLEDERVAARYAEEKFYNAFSGSDLVVVAEDRQRMNRLISLTAEKLRRRGYTLEPEETFAKRLLTLATGSCRVGETGLTDRDVFLGRRCPPGASPVYRAVLDGDTHVFCLVGEEDWSAGPLRDYEPPTVPRGPLLRNEHTDARLTRLARVQPRFYGARDGWRQLDFSRNEMFNDRLACVNLVLDLDFRLQRALTPLEIHGLVRRFRACFLRVLETLLRPPGEWDRDSHPVYFFKTECPVTISAATDEADFDFDFDEENGPDLDRRPCGCREKLGLRAVCPLPAPFAAASAGVVAGLAKLIQQAALMDPELLAVLDDCLQSFEFIDSAVYAHGRSLRTPYSYKVSLDGGLFGRLLPLYCLPPSPAVDAETFVSEHSDPARLLFHALPPGRAAPTIYLTELKGAESSAMVEKCLGRSESAHRTTGRSLIVALLARGVDCDETEGGDAALLAFIAGEPWSRVTAYLREHYCSEKAEEYARAELSVSKKTGTYCYFTLAPSGRWGPKTFSCLRYEHSRTGRSVRASLGLSLGAQNQLCLSFLCQCFAARCGRNAQQTLFAVRF